MHIAVIRTERRKSEDELDTRQSKDLRKREEICVSEFGKLGFIFLHICGAATMRKPSSCSRDLNKYFFFFISFILNFH